MSFLDDLVGAASAPEFINAASGGAEGGTGLDAVLATLGAVFPEPLFIVDDSDTLLWMNLAMADRICRDNALEPDFAVEWLLSQLFVQGEDLVRDGYQVVDGAAPVRVIALADVLGRPEWLSVQICEIPHADRIYRLVVLQDVTPIQRDVLALQEDNAMLSHVLQHDLTTGLASRAGFIDTLTSFRDDQPVAVIAVQIHEFRVMKARHGAMAASRVAERLALDFADLIEDDMVLARLSEDRFAVLIPGDRDPEGLADRADKTTASLCSEHRLPSGLWSVRLKAVCARSGGALTARTLLDEIEDSLTECAAPSGGNLVALHVEGGERLLKRKRNAHLAAALDAALDGGQIEAFLQPAVACETGQVVFVEAVARWRHPESGLIPPSLFLPVAEAAGLAAAVDIAVARSACAAAARWRARGDRVGLSLNLSLPLLLDPEARATLCDVISSCQIDLSDVIFECALPNGPAPALSGPYEGIRSLRAQGLRFALDNAGGHHTDPAALFALAPDFVKVGPQGFARLTAHPTEEDAQARALMHYLRAGQSVDADLVAVGVQDTAAMRAASDLGFAQVQGHLIARPMPVPVFERWLDGCLREGEGLRRAVAGPAPADID